MEQFDVLVAGGGSAGLAAAVSASRLGAKTLLVEPLGVLGGMTAASLIHSICGLYYLPECREGVFCNPGFASEFAHRLLKNGGARGPVRMGRVDVLLHWPIAFARLADEIVQESSNLFLLLHSEVTRLDPDLRCAEIFCRGTRKRVGVGSVIDATGDGVLAAIAGREFEREESRRLQRPAYIFSMQGLEPGALADNARMRIARLIVGAVNEKKLDRGALGVGVRGGSRQGQAYVTIDLRADDFDPTDAACLTRLELEGRKLAGQIAQFLIGNAPGFENSSIEMMPSRAGIRESRRVACEYRLESEDLLRGARFEDAVGVAAWPMELREQATGPKLRYPEGGLPCEIPLRALRARGVPNFFVAGRCLGASHEAQASIRVIGTCLATGESAGIAAALQAAGDEVSAAAVNTGRSRIREAHPEEGI